jgi:hypothetical protein
MHLDDLPAIFVVVVKMVLAGFSWRLFPSHQRGQGIADVSPVRSTWIVPAVVATVSLVHREVIAAASGADKLARLVAGGELLKVVEDAEGHAGADTVSPSCHQSPAPAKPWLP